MSTTSLARMNTKGKGKVEPRSYNLDDPKEIRRLHRELAGYMRVSLAHGTDTEGRAHAYAALCELVRREETAARAERDAEIPIYQKADGTKFAWKAV